MDYQRIIANTNRDNSFMRHNGILLTQMEKDRAVVEADLTETNRNLYGAVHGGMFLSMADCASGGAARSNSKGSHLIAEGKVKNRGKTICVVEVEIKDDTGKLLCGGTFTMFCVGKLDLDSPTNGS